MKLEAPRPSYPPNDPMPPTDTSYLLPFQSSNLSTVASLVSFSLQPSCGDLNLLPCLNWGDSSVNHNLLVVLFLYTLITRLQLPGILSPVCGILLIKEKERDTDVYPLAQSLLEFILLLLRRWVMVVAVWSGGPLGGRMVVGEWGLVDSSMGDNQSFSSNKF